MQYDHPFRKQFCIFFISIALISTYVTIRDKYGQESSSAHNTSKSFSISNTSHITPLSLWDVFNETLGDKNSQGLMWKRARITLNFSEKLDRESSENQPHSLYILGLFDLSTRWGDRRYGISELLSAQLAVKHVNEYNILPGYILQMLVNDTKVWSDKGATR